MSISNLIDELKSTIKDYEADDFLKTISIHLNNFSQDIVVENNKMDSREQGLLFLIEFFLSLDPKGSSTNYDWGKICNLLNKISKEHINDFLNQFKLSHYINSNLDISVISNCFHKYFDEGFISYREQTIDRINRIVGNINNEELSGRTQSLLSLFNEISTLTTHKYRNNNKDINNFVLDFNWISYLASKSGISVDVILNYTISLNEFITSKSIHYGNDRFVLTKPIIKLTNNEYQIICPKYLYLSLYNNIIDKYLKENTKPRDMYLETKTYDLFSDFFDTSAQIYFNYKIDINTKHEKEKDLLIIYKNKAIIIECKAPSYRAPMFSIEKSYKKLRKDFDRTLQYAYDQTADIYHRILRSNEIEITEKKTTKTLDISKIDEIYTILVNIDDLGVVQSNTSLWFKKDPSISINPYAISIDNLELLLLIIKDNLDIFNIKEEPISIFFEYLKIRSIISEKVLNNDELTVLIKFLEDKKTVMNDYYNKKYIRYNEMLTSIIDREIYYKRRFKF